MKFWASSEAEQLVDNELALTRQGIEQDLAVLFLEGSLASIDFEFCYIPIVMGPDFAEFYPPRSNFDEASRRLYHSPVLDFETFKSGDEAQMSAEYIQGLQSSRPLLLQASVDNKLIDEFFVALHHLKEKFATSNS